MVTNPTNEENLLKLSAKCINGITKNDKEDIAKIPEIEDKITEIFADYATKQYVVDAISGASGVSGKMWKEVETNYLEFNNFFVEDVEYDALRYKVDCIIKIYYPMSLSNGFNLGLFEKTIYKSKNEIVENANVLTLLSPNAYISFDSDFLTSLNNGTLTSFVKIANKNIAVTVQNDDIFSTATSATYTVRFGYPSSDGGCIIYCDQKDIETMTRYERLE